MYFNVVEALYIEEYKINLKFENGKTGVVNLAEYILQGEIFQPLQSLENFKNFTVTMEHLHGIMERLILHRKLYMKKLQQKKLFLMRLLKKWLPFD